MKPYLGVQTLIALEFFGTACGQAVQAEQSNPATSLPAIQLPQQPNILWLVAEDMSPYLASYGDTTVATPNLDRLVRESVRYTNVYSVSGVCAPSRFALATGTYPTSGGAQHMRTNSGVERMASIGLAPYEAVPAPEVRMMSEVLRQHGYYATNRAKGDYQFVAPVTAWDESGGRAHWRNRPADSPFFSVFNFFVTHESQVWVKANDPWMIDPALAVPIPPYLPDTDAVRRDVRRVYSNVVEMDLRVGEVLTELEADGLLDETIVVFYSDHGGPLPRQKRRLYDSGLHVPMIVRFPGAQRAGTVDDQLVSFVDFAPTTFSLAGIEPPGYLEGQAFLGPHQAGPRRYLHAAADRFDEQYDATRAVRDARFKYLRHLAPEMGYYVPVAYREQMATMQELLRLRDAGELNEVQSQWFRSSRPEEELFDTDVDPHELNNLAADPAYADKLVELRAELDQWMAATGDRGWEPETDLRERLWPGGPQPVTAAPTAARDGDVVTLRSDTVGASVGYQLVANGETPGARWQVYRDGIQIPAGHSLRAVAHRIGYAPSEVIEIRGPNSRGI